MSSDTGKSGVVVATVVHPGAMDHVPAMLAGLAAQVGPAFTVVVGADGVGADVVGDLVASARLADVQVIEFDGPSPVDIRNALFTAAASVAPVVVMQDADDVAGPHRIRSLVSALQGHDLVGHAMRIVDKDGVASGAVFGVDAAVDRQSLVARNFLGLGNTAYRSSLLTSLLPVPSEAPVMDWNLAVRAASAGARIRFLQDVLGDYRLHDTGSTCVLTPVKREDVEHAIRIVSRHLATVATGVDDALADLVRVRANDVDRFAGWWQASADHRRDYLDELNAGPRVLAWWEIVAHESQRRSWKQ